MDKLKYISLIILAIFITSCSSCFQDSSPKAEVGQQSSDAEKVKPVQQEVNIDGDDDEDTDNVFVEYRTVTDGDNSFIRIVRHGEKKTAKSINYPPNAHPYLKIFDTSKIKLYQFPEYKDKKRFSSNSYGIIDPETSEALIIDPGIGSVRMIEFWVSQLKLDLVAIVLTHGHLDHCGGVTFLKEQFPDAVFYAPAKDDEWMRELSDVELFGTIAEVPPKTDKILKDQDVINVGRLGLQTIATPGHTVGSVCFYMPEEKILFSGDTLFHQNIGTTRFEHSLTKIDIIKSIKYNLKKIPDDVLVFTGHGVSTKMGKERASNPYLQNDF